VTVGAAVVAVTGLVTDAAAAEALAGAACLYSAA